MRILNIFFFCLLSLGLVQAQDDEILEVSGQDQVILKNGDEFIGTIIEYVHESHVVLQSRVSLPFRFEASEIEQVRMDYLAIRPRAHRSFKLNKFYYAAELGTIVSSDKNYGLQANAGVVRQFNQWLGLGLGMSYTDYAEYYNKMERIAAYVSLRTYYRDDFVTPYSELNLGYGFVIDQFEEFETVFNNGYYVNPKFGLRFGTSDFMWTLHVGASIQHTESELSENPWGSWQQDRLLKRTQLGFGLIF